MTNSFVSLFVFTLALPLTTPAQKGAGTDMPVYNQGTEVTVRGIVQEVKTHEHQGETGIHALVKTDYGTFDVHFGPSSFLAARQLTLQRGDQIEVTGSRVQLDGADALLAREVRKYGASAMLRNDQGAPLWSQVTPVRMYNPKTENTVTGTVTEVRQCACGGWSGTVAMVNTGTETVAVHLAPQRFLTQKQLDINQGDRLEITGSMMDFDGQDVILARAVRKNGTAVALRTDEGVPLWPAGMGRGSASRAERPPTTAKPRP